MVPEDLRWKTCLRQNCSLGFSACSEGPDFGQNTNDDDIYWSFHPPRRLLKGWHLYPFHFVFITSKTATLVPEIAVEDLPLDRTAWFLRLQSKTGPRAEHTDDDGDGGGGGDDDDDNDKQ